MRGGKKVALLIGFCCGLLYGSAQMKMFPADLHLGQRIDSLEPFVTYKDTMLVPRSKELATVYSYANKNFKSLISDSDIVKTSLLIDSSGKVVMIQIIFKCADKEYFNTLRKFLPNEPANLERYGMKPEGDGEQIFENVIRYKKYFISTSLNGSGDLYTMNTYDSIDTAFLTVGYSPLILVRKL